MKVAVLKGGRGLERQVSLRSGARVEDALAALGHEVVAIDVGSDLVSRLRANEPDVAFVALHGIGGEDGTAQELLEILGIPYTGPGVRACMRSIDKVAAKQELVAADIPTPEWAAFNALAFRELGAAETLDEIGEQLGYPLVIKPASGGSSLGVRFAASAAGGPRGARRGLLLRRPGDARAPRRWPRARRLAHQWDRTAVGRGASPARRTASPTRRATRSGAPSTSARPPWAPHEGQVLDAALRTWDVLGFDGFGRVDMILAEDGP